MVPLLLLSDSKPAHTHSAICGTSHFPLRRSTQIPCHSRQLSLLIFLRFFLASLQLLCAFVIALHSDALQCLLETLSHAEMGDNPCTLIPPELFESLYGTGRVIRASLVNYFRKAHWDATRVRLSMKWQRAVQSRSVSSSGEWAI